MTNNLSPEKTQKILDLMAVGKSDAEIAEEMWMTEEEIAPLRTGQTAPRKKKAKAPTPKKTETSNTLEQMGREERLKHLQDRFSSNLRTKMVMASFSNEEKAIFAEEYFNVLKSTESITEAEDITLFMAILEFVLAMKALQFKNTEERLYAESMRGQIKKYEKGPDGKTEINPQWRGGIDPRFSEEYSDHLKNYEKMIDSLKLNRKQRLDKIKSEKRSLVDIALELSSTDSQAQAGEEIERLTKLKDEELKSMLDSGYILGKFTVSGDK